MITWKQNSWFILQIYAKKKKHQSYFPMRSLISWNWPWGSWSHDPAVCHRTFSPLISKQNWMELPALKGWNSLWIAFCSRTKKEDDFKEDAHAESIACAALHIILEICRDLCVRPPKNACNEAVLPHSVKLKQPLKKAQRKFMNLYETCLIGVFLFLLLFFYLVFKRFETDMQRDRQLNLCEHEGVRQTERCACVWCLRIILRQQDIDPRWRSVRVRGGSGRRG